MKFTTSIPTLGYKQMFDCRLFLGRDEHLGAVSEVRGQLEGFEAGLAGREGAEQRARKARGLWLACVALREAVV